MEYSPNPNDAHNEQVQMLARGINEGIMGALARAITLNESLKPNHAAIAVELGDALYASRPATRRIGITGPPGVGKSTFIGQLAASYVDSGNKVAILTADPGNKSGGSIMADYTRMSEIWSGTLGFDRRPSTYVRQSPTHNVYGGLTNYSYESMLLCEAAGFEVVIIESVGVGQTEDLITNVADQTIMLMEPDAGGDEWQAMKGGAHQTADHIVITKGDKEPEKAQNKRRELSASLLESARSREYGFDELVVIHSKHDKKSLTELTERINMVYEVFEATGIEARRQKNESLLTRTYLSRGLGSAVLNLINQQTYHEIGLTPRSKAHHLTQEIIESFQSMKR